MNMKDLSEFGQKQWDAEQITMEEVLGKQVTILDVHWLEGENGEYASMLLSVDGETRFMNNGGRVIMELLRKASEADSLPVSATFVQKMSAKNRLYVTVK